MLDEQSLQEILDGVEPEQVSEDLQEVTQNTDAEPEDSPKGEAEQPDGGKTSEESKAEETPSSKDDEQHWKKNAFLDEKRKRQALEKELESLKRAQQEKEQEKDFLDDPDAAISQLKQDFRNELVKERVALMRELEIQANPDFVNTEQEFLALAQENEVLLQQVLQSPNPVKFVNEYMDKLSQQKELENLDEYKSKLKAELRAELEAEIKGEVRAEKEKAEAKRQALSPSLAKISSSQSQNNLSASDDSLSAILGR